MPAGDRSGPSGQGPGTGRAFGYCYGFDSPGYTKGPGRGMGRAYGSGRGLGRGFGRGAGFGRGMAAPWQWGPANAWPQMSKEDELKMLKSEADALKRSQKEIEKRLEELGKEDQR